MTTDICAHCGEVIELRQQFNKATGFWSHAGDGRTNCDPHTIDRALPRIECSCAQCKAARILESSK